LGKNTRQTQGFAMHPKKKRMANYFSCAFSLCRVPFIKRTAKKFFAVRPIENARQRFSRTAKLGFPVV
jgi:hypothetical protein